MGVFRDLTGQTYGSLTFLRPRLKDKRRRTVWEARCTCGRLTEVAGTRVTSGHVASCGCLAVNRPVDITGQRFGRLKALRLEPQGASRAFNWTCLCDCGSTVVVPGTKLRHGHTKSCGCLSVDTAAALNLTHGLSKTSGAYRSWLSMRSRCLYPTHKDWHNYGGRGITFCRRWERFENFYADMGERPPGLTLDRKDNDKGYSKSNCRWATRSEQARNQRRWAQRDPQR